MKKVKMVFLFSAFLSMPFGCKDDCEKLLALYEKCGGPTASASFKENRKEVLAQCRQSISKKEKECSKSKNCEEFMKCINKEE